MKTKVTCYNLRHAPKDDKSVYLDAELDSAVVQIPITSLLYRIAVKWNREDIGKLSAAMPKEIEVVDNGDGIAVERNAFIAWWELSREIQNGGLLMEHHKEVFGTEYADAWWFKCAPRCYLDPCPISSGVVARAYIKERLPLMDKDVLLGVPYDVWRAGSLETLKVGDHYINAYSFSRKPVTDPDIALALAFDKLAVGIDMESDSINTKYGLKYR